MCFGEGRGGMDTCPRWGRVQLHCRLARACACAHLRDIELGGVLVEVARGLTPQHAEEWAWGTGGTKLGQGARLLPRVSAIRGTCALNSTIDSSLTHPRPDQSRSRRAEQAASPSGLLRDLLWLCAWSAGAGEGVRTHRQGSTP